MRPLFLAAALLIACTPFARAADYIIGADLSFLRQAETDGTVFKDNNQPTPALQIFHDHGYNWIRLRLFNDPAAVRTGRPLPNDLPYTLALAQDAKHLGYKLLLDFHYSDTWADPGKQFLPAAWQNKSHADLVTAVHDYTRDTLLAFQKAGVMPDMVQTGNEITNGMLWPDGKLSGQGSTPGAWDRFTDLIKAGIAGVHDAAPDHPPRLMIQIDRGADKAGTKYFFDKLLAAGVDFDVIGQSYYPWYHGTLLDLRENLAFMAQTYKKDIVVVECAYNWRPTEYRTAPAPFPESPEGQKAFLEAVNQLVMNTPDNRGIGLFWWEAAVDPRTGLVSRSMFDTDANALPVLTTFDPYTRGKTPHPPRPTTRPRTTAPAQ